MISETIQAWPSRDAATCPTARCHIAATGRFVSRQIVSRLFFATRPVVPFRADSVLCDKRNQDRSGRCDNSGQLALAHTHATSVTISRHSCSGLCDVSIHGRAGRVISLRLSKSNRDLTSATGLFETGHFISARQTAPALHWSLRLFGSSLPDSVRSDSLRQTSSVLNYSLRQSDTEPETPMRHVETIRNVLSRALATIRSVQNSADSLRQYWPFRFKSVLCDYSSLVTTTIPFVVISFQRDITYLARSLRLSLHLQVNPDDGPIRFEFTRLYSMRLSATFQIKPVRQTLTYRSDTTFRCQPVQNFSVRLIFSAIVSPIRCDYSCLVDSRAPRRCDFPLPAGSKLFSATIRAIPLSLRCDHSWPAQTVRFLSRATFRFYSTRFMPVRHSITDPSAATIHAAPNPTRLLRRFCSILLKQAPRPALAAATCPVGSNLFVSFLPVATIRSLPRLLKSLRHARSGPKLFCPLRQTGSLHVALILCDYPRHFLALSIRSGATILLSPIRCDVSGQNPFSQFFVTTRHRPVLSFSTFPVFSSQALVDATRQSRAAHSTSMRLSCSRRSVSLATLQSRSIRYASMRPFYSCRVAPTKLHPLRPTVSFPARPYRFASIRCDRQRQPGPLLLSLMRQFCSRPSLARPILPFRCDISSRGCSSPLCATFPVKTGRCDLPRSHTPYLCLCDYSFRVRSLRLSSIPCDHSILAEPRHFLTHATDRAAICQTVSHRCDVSIQDRTMPLRRVESASGPSLRLSYSFLVLPLRRDEPGHAVSFQSVSMRQSRSRRVKTFPPTATGRVSLVRSVSMRLSEPCSFPVSMDLFFATIHYAQFLFGATLRTSLGHFPATYRTTSIRSLPVLCDDSFHPIAIRRDIPAHVYSVLSDYPVQSYLYRFYATTRLPAIRFDLSRVDATCQAVPIRHVSLRLSVPLPERVIATIRFKQVRPNPVRPNPATHFS